MAESGPAAGITDEKSGGDRPASETFGVTCPECGGSLRIGEGEKSVRCGYCSSALSVTRPRGFRGYYLPAGVTAGKARLEALQYLNRSTGGRIKARHASILDMRLVNVPFWRMTGTLAGWVCGERVTTRQVEDTVSGPHGSVKTHRTLEEREPYSKVILKRVDWSSPACSLRHLGLQGISLKARMLDWEEFDHGLKKTMDIALPLRSKDEAEKDGLGYLTGLTVPRGSDVKARRFRIFDSEFSIYYYPVYIMRYRHRDIIYSITVDGGDGRVIRGDFPETRRVDLSRLFFVPALAAVMAGTWFPLLAIAAGILYAADTVRGGSVMMPHRWLAGRLEGWFGGAL